MRKRFLQLLLLACGLFVTVIANAQDQQATDTMRSNGKIYVVMAICVTILVGLILYVVSIDRKISKLEKQDW